MTSNILSEISPYLINLIIPCLETIEFFKDTRILLAITGILPILLLRLNSKFLFNWNNLNIIIIKHSDPYGPRIMRYIFNHHQLSIKNILLSTNNKKKETIEKLKKDIEITYQKYKIYINIEEKQINAPNNQYNNNNTQSDFLIFFKSKAPIQIIREFIDQVTNENYVHENKNMINAYYIKSIKQEKNNEVYWVNINIATNKELKYVYVSDDVKLQFCDRIKDFVENETYYKERGLPYKKSFLLYGPPGCGKTSLLKAISVEYNLPVFIFNLGSLDNENLISLLFEINNYLKKSERYIVLLEDFDRILEKIQKNNQDRYYDESHKNNLTMDCLLNFLDGIDESYGRITLITANDISSIMNNDALCRPGRIDHMVKLEFCNNDQVQKISNIYNFELSNNEIEIIVNSKITPAKLINIFSISTNNDELLEKIKKNDTNICGNDGLDMGNIVNQTNGFGARKWMAKKRQRSKSNMSHMSNNDLDRKKKSVENALKRADTEIKKCDSKKAESEMDKKICEIEKKIAKLKKEKILHEKEKVLKIMDIKANNDNDNNSDTDKEKDTESNIGLGIKDIQYDIMLNKINSESLVNFEY